MRNVESSSLKEWHRLLGLGYKNVQLEPQSETDVYVCKLHEEEETQFTQQNNIVYEDEGKNKSKHYSEVPEVQSNPTFRPVNERSISSSCGSYKKALSCEDSDVWPYAIKDEIQALEREDVMKFPTLPAVGTEVDERCVFNMKKSLSEKITTYGDCIKVAVGGDNAVHQLVFDNSCFHANLSEGYAHANTRVWKSRRALCNLKRSGRNWNEALNEFLLRCSCRLSWLLGVNSEYRFYIYFFSHSYFLSNIFGHSNTFCFDVIT